MNNTIPLSKIKLSILRKNNKKILKRMKKKLKIIKDFDRPLRYNMLKNLKFNKRERTTAIKMYDIKKKYIRYFINNRLLYKIHNFKSKQNYKFYSKHFRYISSVDIKTRLYLFETSLKNIIIKLKYAYSMKTSIFFIKAGFLFVNGLQELNFNKFLKLGDYLELVYSRYLIKLKKNLKKYVKKNIWLYKKYIFRKTKIFETDDNKNLKVLKLCKIFIFYKNKLYSSYQTDLKTFSIIFIKKLNIKQDISYFNKKYNPIYYFKLLNWKILS